MIELAIVVTARARGRKHRSEGFCVAEHDTAVIYEAGRCARAVAANAIELLGSSDNKGRASNPILGSDLKRFGGWL